MVATGDTAEPTLSSLPRARLTKMPWSTGVSAASHGPSTDTGGITGTSASGVDTPGAEASRSEASGDEGGGGMESVAEYDDPQANTPATIPVSHARRISKSSQYPARTASRWSSR